MMKAIALFSFLFFSVAAWSQTSINNYKYVVVPEKFSFSKSENQYGLNMLTKLLLNEKGFSAYVSNEDMPQELATNKCNALTVDAIERNSLFVTRVTLVLKDCFGNIVYKTREGKSREKEFQTAYDMALRDAFVSITEEPYKYDGTVAVQNQRPAAPASTPAPSTTNPAPTPSSTTPAQPATPAPAPVPGSVTDATGVLYAQATPNGYQLIDTTPKKVLTLLKTSMLDFFIAEDGAAKGVVFKKNEEWIFEYYKDGKLVSHKLQIKF